jgi:hypothetical protein
MVIDPRTNRVVNKPSNCHLIPECFGVSNLTVPLDGDFDSKIGSYCDAHLHQFFQLITADKLKVSFAMKGGSNRLRGEIDLKKKRFALSRQRLKVRDLNNYFRKALGVPSYSPTCNIEIEEATSVAVLMPNARLSMVNSAFLILHYLGRPEILSPHLGFARHLLYRASQNKLKPDDQAEIERIAPELGVGIKTKETHLQFERIRELYDADWEIKDGSLVDFPHNCVRDESNALVIRLPYGKCLRGIVTLPLRK